MADIFPGRANGSNILIHVFCGISFFIDYFIFLIYYLCMAYPFTFNLPRSLYVEVCFLYKGRSGEHDSLIHSANLYFFIDVCRPFTFNVITDMFRFRSILFLLYLDYFWLFHPNLLCFNYIFLYKFLVDISRIMMYTPNYS